MSAYAELSQVLGVDAGTLERIDQAARERTGRAGVMDKVVALNKEHIGSMLGALGLPPAVHADDVISALREQILRDEKELLAYVAKEAGANQFDRAASLARRIARVGKGYFLKKDRGARILHQHAPKELLNFLQLTSVDELLEKHDIPELFSALRFIESEAWMHETFRQAYVFTPDDFEERDIEVRVLGPEWAQVASKFVAKKHHNVSHLKEFGVIFLNPIREDLPGKFIRDFALLFHYFHEVEFYSKMFRAVSRKPDFAARFASLLRGDVPQVKAAAPGEWLIIQRYLWKDDPADPRLSLPHVNPESVHWFRGERDLAEFGKQEEALQLERWGDLDWVGHHFIDDHGNIVSFDLEDNAMSAVSAEEGKKELQLTYHQREAIWTKLFREYAGGEDNMEKLLIENISKGSVQF